VIHRKEESALGEIHDERDKIVPTALNLGMVFLGDVIDAEVHLRAAGHADGDFLAEKEIGILAQGFCGIDGIVVGNGHHGHASLFRAAVDIFRLVVGLLANAGQTRGIAHAGPDGMDVEVAAHSENGRKEI